MSCVTAEAAKNFITHFFRAGIMIMSVGYYQNLSKKGKIYMTFLVQNTQTDDLTINKKFLNCTQIKTLLRLTPL